MRRPLPSRCSIKPDTEQSSGTQRHKVVLEANQSISQVEARLQASGLIPFYQDLMADYVRAFMVNADRNTRASGQVSFTHLRADRNTTEFLTRASNADRNTRAKDRVSDTRLQY